MNPDELDRPVKHSHCSYCGAAFIPGSPWPRVCLRCGQSSFANPIPVTVVLIPVDDGVLVMRRAIPPQQGMWALPGGYVDAGESWQAAGAREAWEEARIRLDPDTLHPIEVFSASNDTLIIAAVAPAQKSNTLAAFTPNDECSERTILTQPIDLAFALHTRLVSDYLNGHPLGYCVRRK